MSSRIRVASYNLRGLKDDAVAAATVVRTLDPDVLLLQEVPRHPFSGWRIAGFARRCGLRWSGRTRRLSGTSLMTSDRVVATNAVDRRLPVARWANPRSYTTAQVRRPGGPALTVVSLHLSLLEEERVAHTTQILSGVDAHDVAASNGPPGRLVIGGDLNETLQGRAWQLLGGRLTLASPETPTFPSARPHRWIDAIFTDPGLRVLPHTDIEWDPALLSAATDHLPVWVDLEVAEQAP